MRRRIFVTFVLSILMAGMLAQPAAAETRLIVRSTLGSTVLNTACLLLRCTVKYSLDGTLNDLFLVTAPDLVDVGGLIRSLGRVLGVTGIELDLPGQVSGATATGAPAGLYDRTPVNYYGTSVWRGYAAQPAAQIVRLADAHSAFGVRGAGIVAVIDTGVDPEHPALRNALVPGYDFTRNREGMGSERGDVVQSTAAVVDGNTPPALVNQSTAAVVDQSTAAVVDNPRYAAFGHGTMVAGVVRLVAPRAYIMSLKAFGADGSGYTSDVLRAIYRAVQNNARVLNMSFSFDSYSNELNNAIAYANRRGVICVASAGNDGQRKRVYPASLDGVISVASTTNNDQRANFSNYGQDIVWVGAPGEAIITTYPFGTYAATWGTSFSAPFVSGAAALMLDLDGPCNTSQAAAALANAQRVSTDLGNGRVDMHRAMNAWRNASR